MRAFIDTERRYIIATCDQKLEGQTSWILKKTREVQGRLRQKAEAARPYLLAKVLMMNDGLMHAKNTKNFALTPCVFCPPTFKNGQNTESPRFCNGNMSRVVRSC